MEASFGLEITLTFVSLCVFFGFARARFDLDPAPPLPARVGGFFSWPPTGFSQLAEFFLSPPPGLFQVGGGGVVLFVLG